MCVLALASTSLASWTTVLLLPIVVAGNVEWRVPAQRQIQPLSRSGKYWQTSDRKFQAASGIPEVKRDKVMFSSRMHGRDEV